MRRRWPGRCARAGSPGQASTSSSTSRTCIPSCSRARTRSSSPTWARPPGTRASAWACARLATSAPFWPAAGRSTRSGASAPSADAAHGPAGSFVEGNTSWVLREPDSTVFAADALFDVLPIGLVLLEAELRLVRINHALTSLAGLPLGDQRGSRLGELWPAAEAAEQAGRQVLASGEPAACELDPVRA